MGNGPRIRPVIQMAQSKIRLLIRQLPILSFHRQRRSVTPKTSPSQYRKEMASEESRGQSDDEEEEEEEDGEEEEMDEEEESPEPAKEKSVESMYSEVINIARRFTTILEDTRKKELMSRKKSARQFPNWLYSHSSAEKVEKYRD